MEHKNSIKFLENSKIYQDVTEKKYINQKKIVLKPWGKEIWLELNDKYCYKRIHINSGHKTSYQFHNNKLETNFIIKGKAEVWLENDNGFVDKFIMKEGDFFTVLPPRKHRVIAITDIILQEVSTPEVDDVIRINDEFGRKDGKILDEHYKTVVCILAAGTGSRLGEMGKKCHKSLLPVKDKALLSHIIDKFDEDHEILIAVGYLKDQIIEYINFAHESRKIKFIKVEPYEGKNSGPAFSLECCKKYLQRPFYFCVSDFYTEDRIQNLNFTKSNWISLKETNIPELYSTVKMKDGKILDLKNKSKNGYSKAFTGIGYIYDYKLFWEQFEINVDDTKEVVDVFKNIELFNFNFKEINTEDAGNTDLYLNLIEKYEGKNKYLHKNKFEHKYIKNNTFIKACDKDKIIKLFERSKHLVNFIPKLEKEGNYFFSYEFFKGKTLYELDDTNIYIKFFEWYGENFCNNYINVDNKIFSIKFYKEKTYSRLNMFKKITMFNSMDNIENINNINNILTMDKYLDKIDWEYLYDGLFTEKFHGDLQFDNIVYNGNNFKLIDWREDFGGNTQYGDIYYDFAKLYGGMILNYNKLKNKKNYSHKIIGDRVIIESYKDENLEKIMNNQFIIFSKKHNIDFKKVKILTALIFLNMAPLHIDNFDIFLFFKSKHLLAQILN
jgi:CTP:phosphocholine cytidylyltransferase-like protein/mannose-6-phosphate isomerase-like protein (cupin superfamily)